MKSIFNHTMRGYDLVIVENRADGTVDVISSGNMMTALRKAMEVIPMPQYDDRTFRFSFDFGDGEAIITPQDRALGFTATDLWTKIWEDRLGQPPKSVMFENVRIENGKVKADVKEKEDIYGLAIDAALLSRQHGGKTVEFLFSGRRIEVDGGTRPEDIEARFAAKQPKPNLPKP